MAASVPAQCLLMLRDHRSGKTGGSLGLAIGAIDSLIVNASGTPDGALSQNLHSSCGGRAPGVFTPPR